MIKRLTIVLLTLFSSNAYSQSCGNIIEASKVKNTVIETSSAVLQAASNFCKEYSKTTGTEESKNYGGSFKLLSASFGSSGASREQVASKYCSQSSLNQANANAYRNYVEIISPGAFNAYDTCIKMSKDDIRFNVDPAAILPKEFSLSVSFTSTKADQKTAKMGYTTSEDVRCSWNGIQGANRVIPTGSTAFLKCKRQDQSIKSYVAVADLNNGRAIPLTLPWRQYNAEGVPVNTIHDINNQLSALNRKIISADNRITHKHTGIGKKGTCTWHNITGNSHASQPKGQLFTKVCPAGTYANGVKFKTWDKYSTFYHHIQCCQILN